MGKQAQTFELSTNVALAGNTKLNDVNAMNFV